MNNYLIFRTDRIGDFLTTAILIRSIKFNDASAKIVLIASKKNYSYIKEFNNIDEVILLEDNFISKLNIIFKLRKKYFDTIIIHDNKKRSKIISFLINAKNKINIEKIKNLSHIKIIKEILKKLDFTFNEEALNILNEKNIKIQNKEKYVLFHFDEKWIYKDYIDKYVNIEPSVDELIIFLGDLNKKTEKRIIITTGLKTPRLLKECMNKIKDINVSFLENLNFSSLENIVVNSDLLIACHGAISHVAAAKEVKQIDIIDLSYNYSRWTEHFRNYSYINRTKFNKLSKQILETI